MVLSLSLITSLSVCGTQSIPIQSLRGLDNPYTHHSLSGGSDNPYTHHSLPSGTQNIPLLITVCLVVIGLPLYSSQSPWWYSEYPFTHRKPLVNVSLSLYSSQFPWWYSDYPFIHQVCLVILKLSLYTSQSSWWY